MNFTFNSCFIVLIAFFNRNVLDIYASTFCQEQSIVKSSQTSQVHMWPFRNLILSL